MGTRREYRRVVPGASRPEYRLHHAKQAVYDLKDAREHARLAGAGFLLPRIDRALNSARGAVRNAEYRLGRRHRARDPHCTCNDCMDHHIRGAANG